MSEKIVIEIDPVTAPRQTRSDVWKQRPCVMRYRAYRDELRLKLKPEQLSFPCKVTFFIGMPDSWSNKKKSKMVGQPHLQTPDFDNLAKGFFDGLFEQDSHVWSVWVEKRWWTHGKIEIERMK